jgi:putative flavoprotein involved in K+ transport
LATASHLLRAGLDALVLEQGRVPGSGWRERPGGLRLTTPRRLSSLPYYPMEAHHGRWPTGAAWAEYLQRYAERMRLRVVCDQRVLAVDRHSAAWEVQTQVTEYLADAVVIATGEDRRPVLPDVPGIEDLRIPLMHSSQPFPVRQAPARVLVIGGGTSAGEIAVDLTNSGHCVALSVRRMPVVLPRQLFGVPTSSLGLVADRAPAKVLDAVGSGVQWVAFRRLDWSDRDARHKLSERRHRRYAPMIDGGIVRAIKRGDVEVVPAAVRFRKDSVELRNKRAVRPDLIVTATGFEPGLEAFIRCSDVLDCAGRPVGPAELAVTAPGLHFVGLRPRIGPLLPKARDESKRVASAISRYLADRVRDG